MATTATPIETTPVGSTGLPFALRALIWGILGYLVGSAIVMGIRALAGLPAFDAGQTLTVGFLMSVPAFILGAGAWETWGKGWVGKETVEYDPPGWRQYFGFNLDHKVIGIQYLVTFIVVFILAGGVAMMMRAELAEAGRTIVGPATFTQYMSLHGFLMVLVAVTAVPGAFGNFAMPLMVGAEDMAFPRLNALSFWLWPPAVILLLASPFFGGWNSGWTAYPPLSATNGIGQMFYILAFIVGGLSSIVASVNFITTVVKMRAKGLSWGRVPIFVWSILFAAILSLFFTQSVAVAVAMVGLDRIVGGSFFNAGTGGLPVLYQHIFWFYSHPAVYVMVLPSLGAMLEILPVFARKPLFGYWWAVGGLGGVSALSGVVWAHHMFTVNATSNANAGFMFSTEAISVPTGLVFLAAIGTLWRGRLWMKPPMLFALAVIFNFVIGGITGVFLSDIPADYMLQDTYWVVAHFHYTIVGAGIFGLFAAIYYWYPKMFGRMLDERLAKIHFWMMFLGFNITFLPMFWLGLNGMNRRIADYSPELEPLNRFVSMAGFFLGISFLFFLWNFVWSWKKGEKAPASPWGAKTLEWVTSSPPPKLNFDGEPVVVGSPYRFGPDDVHGVIETEGGAP